MKILEFTTAAYAFVTNTTRYRPEIVWSSECWTHNVFRFYELLFGRKYGVRCEVSFAADERGSVVEYHTWEAAIAGFEGYVRSVFKKYKPRLVKVYVPTLAMANGYTSISGKPYVFAIAYDNSGVGTSTNNADASTTFTLSGSATVVVAYGGGENYTDITFDGTTMTEVYNGNYRKAFYRAAPATGSKTITYSAGGAKVITGASYTGTSTTSPLDGTSIATYDSGTTSATLNVTVSASNCWMTAAVTSGNNAGGSITGYTTRQTGSVDGAYARSFDSNATVGTGTVGVAFSWNDGNGRYLMAMAIAPPAAGPTGVKTWNGVTQSTSIKTYFDVAIANVKSVIGVT